MSTQSKYIKAVSCMSTDELDDWYENNVGYRLSEDDPEIVGTLQHPAYVAEMMVLHEHGEGKEHNAVLDELRALGWIKY